MARPNKEKAEQQRRLLFSIDPEIAKRFEEAIPKYQRSKIVANLLLNYLDSYFPVKNFAPSAIDTDEEEKTTEIQL